MGDAYVTVQKGDIDINVSLVNPRDYSSPFVDVRDYSSFSAAIDGIGASEKTLLIPNEQAVATNKTVPSNVTLMFLQGGSLAISAGKTVTINGHIDAGLYQIFEGDGIVTFGTSTATEVYPQWWGAIGDGATDDTIAIQSAITVAIAGDADIKFVNGIYRTTSAINIDRLVDTTHRKFYVSGDNGAVLYVDSAITMFSSTLTHASAPQSENIEFKSITFRVDDHNRNAYVLHGIKFLRISFNNCMFDKIKCLYSDRYIQTYMFINCYIKYWAGNFIFVYGDISVFDLAFIGCWAENGGGLFKAIPFESNNHLIGIRFIGNLIEGLTKRVVEGGAFRGLEITGNYFENNNKSPGGLSAIELSARRDNYGVHISGNTFIVYSENSLTADYYEVNLAYTYGIDVGGNYCNGKLYNNTHCPDLNPHKDLSPEILSAIVVPRIFHATAAPTENPTIGYYAIGDVIWNTAPTGGGIPGWVCTKSGTFGAATDNTGDTDGSTAIITGMTDTSDFDCGQYVDVSAGFPTTGPYRILKTTATSITLDTNSDSVQVNIVVDTSDPTFKAMASLVA